MIGQDVWIGKEVEGRFTGIQTTFIRKIPDALTEDLEHHVYFTKEVEDWDAIRAVVKTGRLVTIETTHSKYSQIPHDLRNRCHILVRICCQELSSLKSTDTVTLDYAPYNCLVSAVYAFQRVLPENYSEDRYQDEDSSR